VICVARVIVNDVDVVLPKWTDVAPKKLMPVTTDGIAPRQRSAVDVEQRDPGAGPST